MDRRNREAISLPACGIGNEEFPLIELKDNLVITGSDTDPEPLLRCLDCGAVHPWSAWLDNAENCPKCGSHNGATEKAIQ